MTDVLLFQTIDGGNVTIEANQDIQLTGGFETDFYLSLFGGNEEDNGSVGNKFNWWANLLENDPAYQFRSKFQNLLISLPLVSGNIRRLEDAAKSDLKPYVDNGSVTELAVLIIMTGPRRISVTINAYADGNKISLTFLANWQAMESEFKTG